MATIVTERLSGAPTNTAAPTDLAAIEDFDGVGIPERTGGNAWSLRAATGADDAWSPQTADGLSLGTAALPWSDAFLASGGVIDWGDGDVTLTHSASALSFAGASSGYVFDGVLSPAVNDGAALGAGASAFSDLFLASGGAIDFANGDVSLTHSASALSFAGASSGYIFDGAIAPAANDGAALGTGASAFSDLFLASGGAIDFADGDVTLTHSANTLAFAGASSGYTFDVAPKVGGSTVALLATENQTLAGGARVTTKDLGNLSGQTITPDPGDRPIQKITNNGAGTIAPGSNQGVYLLVVKNASGAGAMTTSGWSNVSGDAFGTSTSAEYLCHCVVVADFSSMIIMEITS